MAITLGSMPHTQTWSAPLEAPPAADKKSNGDHSTTTYTCMGDDSPSLMGSTQSVQLHTHTVPACLKHRGHMYM